MGLFEKIVYKEIELPFIFIEADEDYAAVAFSIEAYGVIDGQTKYLFMTFSVTDLHLWDTGEYDEMLNVLKNNQGEKIRLRLEYKKNKLVDFELEKKSLIECTKDQRFGAIEALGWGINDKTAGNR